MFELGMQTPHGSATPVEHLPHIVYAAAWAPCEVRCKALTGAPEHASSHVYT